MDLAIRLAESKEAQRKKVRWLILLGAWVPVAGEIHKEIRIPGPCGHGTVAVS